ncbi:MAG: 16S rRNA (adenine(1518)-N(6)/adenine(1519)-N(6))-dimethyltransferase RsmA [Clostridia bacterium]|nr:16S rRNA (adenine(1518)-N(6)/adenine(1519)-N(6))-dimethyltransferase RsmA [Clostridia bacterium]
MNLSDVSEIKALLRKNGFNFSKALGQNFLIDPEVCPNMAEAAIPSGEYGVLEVGPGIGVLTVELAKRAKKVVSVELDDRLFPILTQTLADFDNIELVHGDIMKLDLHQLLQERFGDMPVVVCANLPYYITSPIITMLLSERLPIESITVMVQKEAAERLCAEVGTREAGAVTVAIAYYAQAEQLFFVPKESFLPSPKVDSEVIQLTLRETPGSDRGSALDASEEPAFFSMVKAAFTQRRKTILNSLSAALHVSKEELKEILAELSLSPSLRVESLTLQNLLDLYRMSKRS